MLMDGQSQYMAELRPNSDCLSTICVYSDCLSTTLRRHVSSSSYACILLLAIVYRPLCGGAEQQDSGGAEQQEQRVTTGATRHNWTDYQFIKRWNLQKAATTLNYYAQRSVSTPELRRPSF
jgi:hypothetical protein